MGHEHRSTCLVGFHTIEKIVAPGLSGGHFHQVFDVKGGNDGMPRTELFASFGLDAYTPAALKYQAADWLVGQYLTSMSLDDTAQRYRQAAGSAFRNSPTVTLATRHERVGE